MERLNLNSIVAYQHWCKSNNFSASLNKDANKCGREREFYRRSLSIETLQNHNRTKKGASVIENIYQNKIRVDRSWDDISIAIATAFNTTDYRKMLFSSLMYLQSCTKLIKHAEHIRGIASAVAYFREWKRPLKNWLPKTHNVDRQFSSLLRHLFCEYDVPIFMDSVWMSNQATQQRWYLHLGSGHNIRTAKNLPVNLTKKMAHHFLQAPDHYSVDAALRWAQIIALGGDKPIADAIADTRIVSEFKDDAFWLSVFTFFIKNPMLDCSQINPIVDFIWNQKYENRVVFVGRGVAEDIGPAHPNFCMNGRTVDTLLRQVNAWHRSLGRETHHKSLHWEKSQVGDFEYLEGNRHKGNMRIWRISELLSSRQLIAEGRALRHCVASYANSCRRGRSGIWTLVCEESMGAKKHLTIEVLLSSKRICQLRGKHNRLPTEQEKRIVQRWAQQECLQYLPN